MILKMSNRLEVDFGVWGTIRKVAIVLITLGILSALAAWYIPTLKKISALEKEIELKRVKLKEQEALHRKYEDEIIALKTDPEAVEREARKQLRLAKPEETIYSFESKTTK